MSARVAEECNRILGQELTEDGERSLGHLACKAKVRELAVWEQFKVFSPGRLGTQSKDLVDLRWALTWEDVDGEKTVKARVALKSNRDLDLRDGNVEIAGCASRRSFHLQLTYLCTLEK